MLRFSNLSDEVGVLQQVSRFLVAPRQDEFEVVGGVLAIGVGGYLTSRP